MWTSLWPTSITGPSSFLRKNSRLQGEITLEHLAGAKDLITAKEDVEDVEPYWQEIVPILKQSLQDMDQMKENEGESSREGPQPANGPNLTTFEESSDQIRLLTLKAYQERFKERLRTLLDGTELDPVRFQQEVAFWVERTDITEELVRAESHLTQFRDLLRESRIRSVGRWIFSSRRSIGRSIPSVPR